ncbi:unnamed protein product [Dicrocoelium dendriticum]|nr:unnamed protein product [Dicrocoelium dendriticum]
MLTLLPLSLNAKRSDALRSSWVERTTRSSQGRGCDVSTGTFPSLVNFLIVRPGKPGGSILLTQSLNHWSSSIRSLGRAAADSATLRKTTL